MSESWRGQQLTCGPGVKCSIAALGEGDNRARLHQHAKCLHGAFYWGQHRQDDCQDLNEYWKTGFLLINKICLTLLQY